MSKAIRCCHSTVFSKGPSDRTMVTHFAPKIPMKQTVTILIILAFFSVNY